MKKTFLTILFLLFLIPVFACLTAGRAEAAIVTCSGPDCTIDAFFAMLGKIYDIIVKDIATPLAVLAITIGGILMMISAGNPNLRSKGKTIFWCGVIGLVLAFCSYLIIKTILDAIGYTGTWTSP